MSEDREDIRFYRTRARQECEAAARALDPAVASAHRALALRYAALADCVSASLRLAMMHRSA